MPQTDLTSNSHVNDKPPNCKCENNQTGNSDNPKIDAKLGSDNSSSVGEGGKYWQMRYEKLLNDYNHLQKINQNLEEKLLNVVESFEKKKDELVANIEYEKTTLMADVNKLSTKLVDARIKLHDYEEKELMHASECNSPCHTGGARGKSNGTKFQTSINNFDPNLV